MTGTWSNTKESFWNSGPSHSCSVYPKSLSAFGTNKVSSIALRSSRLLPYPEKSRSLAGGLGTETFALTLLPPSLNVRIPSILPARIIIQEERKKETGSKLTVAGLKTTIQEEGTWRIRKREKSSLIEVFKVEESGTGDIISPAFSAWRSKSWAMQTLNHWQFSHFQWSCVCGLLQWKRMSFSPSRAKVIGLLSRLQIWVCMPLDLMHGDFACDIVWTDSVTGQTWSVQWLVCAVQSLHIMLYIWHLFAAPKRQAPYQTRPDVMGSSNDVLIAPAICKHLRCESKDADGSASMHCAEVSLYIVTQGSHRYICI